MAAIGVGGKDADARLRNPEFSFSFRPFFSLPLIFGAVVSFDSESA